ncbi:hypothetical protein RZS08_38415, partial [Arthrospira platensis SPKY1]|nr:hypothetical protein [Arthrospira platensis SPKY1]
MIETSRNNSRIVLDVSGRIEMAGFTEARGVNSRFEASADTVFYVPMLNGTISTPGRGGSIHITAGESAIINGALMAGVRFVTIGTTPVVR